MRRNVSVADRGDGNDRPVHRHGDASEPVGLSFDLIHQGADQNDHGQNPEKEYGDLAKIAADGEAKSDGFAQELREFEDAEDA